MPNHARNRAHRFFVRALQYSGQSTFFIASYASDLHGRSGVDSHLTTICCVQCRTIVAPSVAARRSKGKCMNRRDAGYALLLGLLAVGVPPLARAPHPLAMARWRMELWQEADPREVDVHPHNSLPACPFPVWNAARKTGSKGGGDAGLRRRGILMIRAAVPRSTYSNKSVCPTAAGPPRAGTTRSPRTLS